MKPRFKYRKGELDRAYAMIVSEGLTIVETARRLGRNAKALGTKLSKERGLRVGRGRDYAMTPVILPKRPASQACSAHPGTDEKLEELCRRYLAGEVLYHKDDNRIPIVRDHHSVAAKAAEELEDDDGEDC